MSRTDLRRRVTALTNAINPAGSLTAKLAELTVDQRRAYDQWRVRCERYYATNPGGAAFAGLLSGDQPPPLRPDARKTLFGPTIDIPDDATHAQAAEIYRCMLDY